MFKFAKTARQMCTQYTGCRLRFLHFTWFALFPRALRVSLADEGVNPLHLQLRGHCARPRLADWDLHPRDEGVGTVKRWEQKKNCGQNSERHHKRFFFNIISKLPIALWWPPARIPNWWNHPLSIIAAVFQGGIERLVVYRAALFDDSQEVNNDLTLLASL